ncbi:cation transporter [Mesorhizobium sp. LSJC265A00]|uniref:gamma-glutamylcyclotransferase n=2 Tax=Mesorhizobium TaxID=68287 RepID=UPI0003CEF491|nr:gamma-glutamylcyclotransferase [Mesorhizobium sp. LSJC265A00]ESX13024.1 cation transporter [Mesorhizobium sp. LSJC265A00]ESY07407.1 cation transporter [Mesorhizobium sp. LNJC399B00]
MDKKPVGRSSMALTADLVARVERVEPDPGPEPGTTEHTDAEFDSLVEQLLSEHRPEALWVFAYGSLIWNPEFAHVEQRPATAPGWHRSFCLTLTRWRGTRDLPALMLALDRGGSCNGIVYRLPAEDHVGQLGQLMRREIDANPPTNVPCWIKVKTKDGPLRALAFVAAPGGRAYAGRLPLEQVADTLARAAGHWGSSAQYLFRTVSKLEESGIRDRNLWRIQDLVAQQIIASIGNANPTDF